MREATASLRKRGDKWSVRIRYYSVDGVRHEKSLTCESKSEARALMYELLSDYRGLNGKCKLGALFNDYIEDCEARGLKSTSLNRYKGVWNKHLKGLGDIYINELKAWQVREYFKGLEIRSTTTEQHIFDLLKRLIKYGYKLGYINNLACIERLDRPQRERRKDIVMTSSELVRLLDFLRRAGGYKDNLLYCYVYLAAELGTRRGELCGLCVDDVDFQNKCVFINKSLVYDNGKTFMSTPKTASGSRKIYISEAAADVLKRLISQNSINKLALGGDYAADCYGGYNCVFRWQNGQAVHPDWFSSHFKKVQLKLGFEKVFRLHDLRHFNASILIAHNVDFKTVQSRLGHADISTTLKIYAHTIEQQQSTAVEVMAAELGGRLGAVKKKKPRKGLVKRGEPERKPSSVLDSHLSGIIVTDNLKRSLPQDGTSNPNVPI